jgi:hypothetical protein
MPGISNGPNSRSLRDTIAETGPGIADDAVVDGEQAPEDVDAADAERLAEALRRKGWGRLVRTNGASAADEAEAHPS